MQINIKYLIFKLLLNIFIFFKSILKLFKRQINLEKIIEYFFLRLSYFGNLQSDLEAINKITFLRSYFFAENFNKKKKFKKKKKYNIGFLVNVSKQNLMDINHFINVKPKYNIFIYDHNVNNLQKLNSHKYKLRNLKLINKNNIDFKILPLDKYYLDNRNNQKKISEIINKDKLDIFIFNTGVRHLKLLDEINAARLISINKTSIFVPHEKIDIQSFQQPPWPYKELDGKIYNFKEKKFLNVNVSSKLFCYTRRNLNFKFEKNRYVILWYGNLKKLAEERFLEIISKILSEFPYLEFHFFGYYNLKHINFIKNFFKYKKIKNYKYKGHFDFKDGIEDGKNINEFKKSLKKTKIMLNSLRMSGGRYAVEAYQFKIPIINYNISDKEWLNCKGKLYYKIKNLFIDTNTVKSEDDYLKLFRKIMNSKNLRQKMIKEQTQKFNKIISGKELWRNLEDII